MSSFLLFYKYIIQVFPGLISNDIMSSFHITPSQSGSLIAITFWTIVITQLFSGIIIDKFGFRIISSGSLIFSTSCGLLIFIYAANNSSILYGYIARIMIGFGMSFATVSYIKATSIWIPSKNFGLVTGLMGTSAMLGALMGQAPLSYLIKYTGSWQEALTLCAYLGIIFGILYFCIIRDHNPNKNISNIQSSIQWNDIKYVLTNKNNWLLMLYSGLTFTAIDVFAGLWGNSYFKAQYHITTENSATIISNIFIGMAIGAPIIGKFSEYFKIKKLMCFFHIIATISLIIVLELKTSPIIASMLLLIFGFSLSIYMLSFVLAKRLNPINVMATVVAFINTGEPVLGAIYDPVIGFCLEKSSMMNDFNITLKEFPLSSYYIAFSFLSLSMILALILLLFIKDSQS